MWTSVRTHTRQEPGHRPRGLNLSPPVGFLPSPSASPRTTRFGQAPPPYRVPYPPWTNPTPRPRVQTRQYRPQRPPIQPPPPGFNQWRPTHPMWVPPPINTRSTEEIQIHDYATRSRGPVFVVMSTPHIPLEYSLRRRHPLRVTLKFVRYQDDYLCQRFVNCNLH